MSEKVKALLEWENKMMDFNSIYYAMITSLNRTHGRADPSAKKHYVETWGRLKTEIAEFAEKTLPNAKLHFDPSDEGYTAFMDAANFLSTKLALTYEIHDGAVSRFTDLVSQENLDKLLKLLQPVFENAIVRLDPQGQLSLSIRLRRANEELAKKTTQIAELEARVAWLERNLFTTSAVPKFASVWQASKSTSSKTNPDLTRPGPRQ